MTPSQLNTVARQRYNAVGDSFFADQEIYDAIYQAELELALETECIEKRYTTSTVVGTREYDAPGNLIRIARITYNGQRLDHHDFVEDDLETNNDETTTSTGTPKFYSLFADVIYLRPTPSEVKTLKIYSVDEPSAVTNTTTLDVPTRYHMNLVDYILMFMFGKDKNYQLSTYHQGRWNSHVLAAKRWQMKRQIGDSYKMVKDVDQMPYHSTEVF